MGKELAIRGLVPLGSISGSVDLDMSQGNIFTCTLIGNVVFTVKNTRPGHVAWVNAVQDGTGSRSVAWNGAGGQTVSPSPYVDPAPSGETMITLVGSTASAVRSAVSLGSGLEGHDSYTTGSPTLVPSAGGRLSSLSGTVTNPALPDASLWIDQSIVVYLDNLVAGVTVQAASGDLINGSATYEIIGPYSWATFYSISANKIAAAPA